MTIIILKRIDVNYFCFDPGKVHIICVMLGILEGGDKEFAPSFHFVFLLCVGQCQQGKTILIQSPTATRSKFFLCLKGRALDIR